MKKRYEKISEEIDKNDATLLKSIDPLLDQLLSFVDLPQPNPNSPLGPNLEIERQKTAAKKDLKEFFLESEDRKKLSIGYEIIKDNLSWLDPKVEKIIKEDFQNAAKIKLEETLNILKEDPLQSLEKFAQELSENPPEEVPSQKEEKAAPSLEEIIKTSKPWMEEVGIGQESFDGMESIGLKLIEEKNYEDATCVYEFLVTLNGPSSPIWYTLARLYQERHLFEQAIQKYTMSLLLNPAQIDAFLNLAVCHLNRNELEDADYNLLLAEQILDQLELSEEKKNDKRNTIKTLKKSIK